jgi:hypothetical protein
MRGLALCLAAGALVIAGCGSDNNSSNAPKQEKVAASGGSNASAGVSAKGRATPASLCAAEGKGKPKKQCVAGLKKLDTGKAANPRSACKGLSKKKTKGVRGKSPYAVCVSAAAKLMAAKAPKSGSGNGAADSSPGNSGSAGKGKGKDKDASDDESASDSGADGSSADDEADPICHDANGKQVPFDSEDVEECDVPDDTSASGSANDDSGSADDSDSSADDE